jgi:hypothetical protein
VAGRHYFDVLRDSARDIPLLMGRVALLGLCLAGSWWAVQLARADRYASAGSEAGLRRAISITPGNASYYQRLGEMPASQALLDQALARNPRRARVWIEKGSLLEARGEIRSAENCFLDAAKVDRTWLPAWTLANFYARHNGGPGGNERLWQWARTAAAIHYADRTAVFGLALRVADTPAEIPARLALSPEALRQYLAYLVREGKVEAGEPVVELLRVQAGPRDLPLLLDYADRAIAAGSASGARRVRFVLAQRGLPGGLDKIVFNSRFTQSPDGRGFDWRWPPNTDGVALSHQTGELRVTLSGKQPESVVVLRQAVLLEAGRKYRLRVEAGGAVEGLAWRLDDRLLAAGEAFEADGLHWLALGYRRPEGRTRAEGVVTLRQVSLEPGR